MKRFLWALGGCALGVLLLLATGMAILYCIVAAIGSSGGMSPSYKPADYDPHLTREASTATVLIAALDRYHRQHTTFPAAASRLVRYLPPKSATPADLKDGCICGWHYRQTDRGKGYAIWRRLGWDPCLTYEYRGSIGSWLFEPGDGSPPIPLIPKP